MPPARLTAKSARVIPIILWELYDPDGDDWAMHDISHQYLVAITETLQHPDESMGRWHRLRLLRRAIRHAEHVAKQVPRWVPHTWDDVRRQVYLETGGQLVL